MTPDDEQLLAVLRATGPVLLDFDGPVCSMYPGDLNLRASAMLRDLVAGAGIEIPPDVAATRDPLTVLRYVGTLGQSSLTANADIALTSLEVAYATTAPPTPGSKELLDACRGAARPVHIVSNNAAEAIDAHLKHRGVRHLVGEIVGRPHARPDQMKPNPRILLNAIALADESPHLCLLVGDSVTDIEAGKAAGIRSIAYAKTDNRRAALKAASPDAVVTSIATLARAIAATHGGATDAMG